METIFDHQIRFQQILNNDVNSQDFKNKMLYAIIAEVVEAGNETAWKSWKQGTYNKDKFVEELADIQLFLINLVISSGTTYKQFEEVIVRKQEINVQRQISARVKMIKNFEVKK